MGEGALEEGGPVVGLLPGVTFERGRCRLEPGDCVVLFSDGVTEATNPRRQEFGVEPIVELFRRRGSAGAREMLERLEGEIAGWLEGAAAHDDVTAVALIRSDA